ncbi:hypothetical protein [Nonomuraea africana]|uniref:hypothetical protein n=1 Tax=Nonomuraea africana TaxID=46171 RepID=UPI003411777F
MTQGPGPSPPQGPELMAQIAEGPWAEITSTVTDLTGHAPRTLDDYLADHAGDFPR